MSRRGEREKERERERRRRRKDWNKIWGRGGVNKGKPRCLLLQTERARKRGAIVQVRRL
jgi:hypothetical protein